MSDAKKTYILIHGAWHGAWCWKRLVPLLEKNGHTVLAPDLPGHGDDKAPFSEINLNTYVYFIQNLILSLNTKVILVGHSLAGVMISQVANNISERIEKLIYIAAFIPTQNRSCLQEAQVQKMNNVGPLLSANTLTNEMRFDLSDPDKVRNAFYHCCAIPDFQNTLKLLQTEPLLPMTESVTLAKENFGKVSKCYIACLKDRGIDIRNQRRMANNADIKNIVSLECDHSPFFSVTNELAEAILNCA